jgi:hypothetical protein
MLAILLIPGTHAASAPEPGWRTFDESDRPDSGRVDPTMLRVDIDLDGDGKTDVARILIDASGRELGLHATLAHERGEAELLERFARGSDEWALRAIAAGCYQGSEETLCLPNPAILMYEAEFGYGALYWRHGAVWRREPHYKGRFPDLLGPYPGSHRDRRDAERTTR